MEIENDFMIENLKVSLHNNGDCHHNSFLVYKGLKKLGYDISLITGIFIKENKKIKHSWLEFQDKILETDPLQLGIKCKDRFCCIITDKKIRDRYVCIGVEK